MLIRFFTSGGHDAGIGDSSYIPGIDHDITNRARLAQLQSDHSFSYTKRVKTTVDGVDIWKDVKIVETPNKQKDTLRSPYC